MKTLRVTLALLAVVTIMATAYNLGALMERRRQPTSACEKAIAANDDGRLAMVCADDRLFVWRKADGEFVGAVDFRREAKQ